MLSPSRMETTGRWVSQAETTGAPASWLKQMQYRLLLSFFTDVSVGERLQPLSSQKYDI